MTDATQADAVRNLKTGALILLTPNNRKNLLKRADMVSTVAVRDDAGKWVDANANQTVGNTVMSNNLQRIVDSLLALNAQGAMLIEAALKLDGGEHYLKSRGLIPEDDAVAPLPGSDVKTEVDTNTTETPRKRRKKRGSRRADTGSAADSIDGI